MRSFLVMVHTHCVFCCRSSSKSKSEKKKQTSSVIFFFFFFFNFIFIPNSMLSLLQVAQLAALCSFNLLFSSSFSFNFICVCILRRHIFFLYSTESGTYAMHVCSAYGEHIGCVVIWAWWAPSKWERNVRIGQCREKTTTTTAAAVAAATATTITCREKFNEKEQEKKIRCKQREMPEKQQL